MRFVAQAMEGKTLDPIRRGLIITQIASLVGLSSDDVQTTLKKLAQSGPGSGPGNDRPTNTSPADALTQGPVIVNGHQSLRGNAKAEAWLLGALLTQPTLYANIREDFNLDLFTTLTDLAVKTMEYLENADDLASCTLADFVAYIDDPQLAGQAIGIQMSTEAGGKVDQLLTDALRALHTTHATPPPDDNPTTEAQRRLDLARLAQSRGEVRQVLPPKQAR
jgi:hypothetical protein